MNDGAYLVVFWIILMPISLITMGLLAGNKYLPPVWDRLFPPTPEYVPEPILPLYEDKVEELVEAIIDERERNPRHVRDDQFRASWNRQYKRLKNRDPDGLTLPVIDEEDVDTIRDWDGNIIRQDFRTKKCDHSLKLMCYHCDKRKGY